MAYRVKNPYKKCHLMDLNLMGVGEYKKSRISLGEVALTVSPLLLLGAYLLASMVPEMTFFAECQNIAGGDICSIRMQ